MYLSDILLMYESDMNISNVLFRMEATLCYLR